MILNLVTLVFLDSPFNHACESDVQVQGSQRGDVDDGADSRHFLPYLERSRRRPTSDVNV